MDGGIERKHKGKTKLPQKKGGIFYLGSYTSIYIIFERPQKYFFTEMLLLNLNKVFYKVGNSLKHERKAFMPFLKSNM